MILDEVLVERNVQTMTQLMQISRPFLFFIPIMALFVGVQFLTNQRRKRGLVPKDWPKVASVVLLVALCLLFAFAKFR
jgi:hypothetical protein